MKQGDWINVNDKLPILGKRVLVCQTFNDGSMFVRAATIVKINGMCVAMIGLIETISIIEGLFQRDLQLIVLI